MSKIPKEELLDFRADITSILSQERLESYKGNIQNYYTNRLLALQAGHKIAEIEVYLRNMLDFCMKRIKGNEWIKSAESLKLISAKSHIPQQDLSPSQILASLMLGEVVELINLYKIENYMLDIEDMDFKKYHWNNRNVGYVNGRKTQFSNVAKVEITLNLIRVIRNRCFHWENLLKTRMLKDKIYPRIATIYPKNEIRKNQTIVGIMPEMILVFLDDLLNAINNPMMKRFQDIKMEFGRD